MQRASLLVGLLFLMAPLALAQTKISGTVQCSKNTLEQMVPAGDRPNHALGVTQGHCTWTKPMLIAGVPTKQGVATGLQEVDGNNVNNHGVYVETMANGDQVHMSYEVTVITKDGQLLQITGHKWQIVGGTGKFKDIKGQGACKGTPTADGGVTYESRGEYTLPK